MAANQDKPTKCVLDDDIWDYSGSEHKHAVQKLEKSTSMKTDDDIFGRVDNYYEKSRSNPPQKSSEENKTSESQTSSHQTSTPLTSSKPKIKPKTKAKKKAQQSVRNNYDEEDYENDTYDDQYDHYYDK